MNRQSFPGHLALALTFIMVAAFAGQMRRVQHSQQQRLSAGRLTAMKRDAAHPPAAPRAARAPQSAEVIVRFRAGLSFDTIRALVARLNDRVEDRIEAVSNQIIVADEDGLSAEAVAAEYGTLAEVEYAEPNFTISLDPSEDLRFDDVLNQDHGDLDLLDEGVTPNDPMFGDQWALENRGDRDGKAKADISAVRAWSKTKGTRKVVVAVLDSGVDYAPRSGGKYLAAAPERRRVLGRATRNH